VSRRPPLTELQPRRIALIKPSALGDIVHSLPVLHALRVRFPDAHLTWIVNRGFESLLRCHPDLDDVLPFDRQRGIRCVPGFTRELVRRRFDLVIDLQGLLRTGLMAAGSLAGRRIGLSSARERAAWFYTDVVRVPDEDAMHAVDRYWLVAEALGAGGAPKVFRLPRNAEAESWAEGVLRLLPRPRFMVAPGSRWVTKRWPVEHFVELLRRGLGATGGSVVLLGSRDEAGLTNGIATQLIAIRRQTLFSMPAKPLSSPSPRLCGEKVGVRGIASQEAVQNPLTPTLSRQNRGEGEEEKARRQGEGQNRVAQSRGEGESRDASSPRFSASSPVNPLTLNPLDLAGKTTLPQLAALLAKADVVLANDSGPMHLAAALGRSVIAPFTCTTITRHGPYAQDGAVESTVWCQGSYLRRCDRLECMRELTPDRLWPKLDEVLRRWQSHCRSA
jgi:ADP-heptose:LPS heptosyltransferase